MDALFGASMAILVCAAIFAVVVRVSVAIFGAFGTAILIAIVAVAAAFAGWQWLIHSDHLALQMLGWAIAGLTVWGTLKGVQVGIRKWREWEPEVEE